MDASYAYFDWSHSQTSSPGSRLGVHRSVQVHRLAWILTYGEPPQAEMDHIDGDKLNNRMANLRLSDRTMNLGNVAKRRGPFTSRFKGVRYHRKTGKWQARIGHGRVNRHLGLYATEVGAAIAYNAKAIELFGEFARLNDVA